MEAPVNLTNLRGMTDGDVEMEKELFAEFYSSFEEGLRSMKENSGDSGAEQWRKQAHALKGTALNLGAEKLGALCRQAQESQTAPEKSKAEMLEQLWAEYRHVQQFLQQVQGK